MKENTMNLTTTDKLTLYADIYNDWRRWGKLHVHSNKDLAHLRRLMVAMSLEQDVEFEALLDSDIRHIPEYADDHTRAFYVEMFTTQLNKIQNMDIELRRIHKTAISDLLIQEYGDKPAA
jgi:hypothetical protein